MRAEKIDCTRCAHLGDCPNRTRLFVNYCGADRKKMDAHIRTAIEECRSRRGRLFKHDVDLHVSQRLAATHHAAKSGDCRAPV